MFLFTLFFSLLLIFTFAAANISHFLPVIQVNIDIKIKRILRTLTKFSSQQSARVGILSRQWSFREGGEKELTFFAKTK